MAQHYTPIWDDWLKVTQELNDQEKGRLIDAIVVYDLGGDWQERIKGNERYVFPGYQSRIDRYKEANAGKMKDKDSESEKTEKTKKPESVKKNKNSGIPNVYVYDKDYINNNVIAHVQESTFGEVTVDPLIVKAQQELNGLTDTHYQELNDYREALTDDVVSYAIDNAVGNGVRNWAYVRAILQGYMKDGIRSVGDAKSRDENRREQKAHPVKKPTKAVSAQQYTQRDYNDKELEDQLGVNDLFRAGVS